jgi:hypothetical protein
MPENVKRYSTAWQQFLVAKKAMLAEYDRALVHSKEQAVRVHHGVVGEASVRDWLGAFLPKRYGVVPGHIRSQGMPHPHQSRHFDVIVYDQLEAPTLWIEENKDKSDTGRVRIIPAEFVRAVLEVKAGFDRRTVREAIDKLSELKPLMAGFDNIDDYYPRYLPASAVLAMVFFELRTGDQSDLEALNLFRTLEFQRLFYGAVVLRGEGLSPDDTALINRFHAVAPNGASFSPHGLLNGMTMTETADSHGQHVLAMMTWSDINFSKFAFDLLALLRRTYRPGFVSSFHGLDFSRGESNW